MSRLRLALPCLLAALAPACIIVDDTDENADCPVRDDGACFAVTADCPPDAVTYTVFTQPVGAEGSFADPFECGVGSAVVVAAGTYDVRVEATTAEGDVVFGAEAVTGQEVADGDDVPLDFEFPEGEGFLFLNWTIEQGGAAVDCEDLGAVSLEVESTLVEAGTSTTDVLPCSHGGWQTRGLELGEYDVTVTLLGEDDLVIAPASDPIPAELAADAELVVLPDITFTAAE